MTPGRIWIRNAATIVTMDDERRELADAGLLIEDGRISAVGADPPDPAAGWQVIDAAGCVVTPGLVNTHHHLAQTLTRAVPAGQDAELFGWLGSLYPVWERMRPEDVFLSAQIGLAELALSGCSMSSDHLYFFANGIRLEDTIEAAGTVGVRFHPTRGAMSMGRRSGGLPPDSMVEREPDILKDCERVIDAFHDPGEGAMVRVGLAPCSPFTVSEGLMRDVAALARDRDVRLHTHLAENAEDVAFSLERFGRRPGDYAGELGWLGEHVWHAHCVRLDRREIGLLAGTGTGVAHCPSSNCRLGSGIAPVRMLRDAGVPVGLGVDGSASSDQGHLLNEARLAMLLQRADGGAGALTAREALEFATRGGARLLGRSGELGSIERGKLADIAIWDVSGLEAAGAWDPVAALVLCGPFRVRDLLVGGRPVVADGLTVSLEPRMLAEAARAAVARLAA